MNLTKKEFIHPHKLGDGLKLLEQCGYSPGGVNDALHLLLACSSGRGGGDFLDTTMVGRWAGDRIAVVGDYAEPGDLSPKDHAEKIYGLCRSEEDSEAERQEKGTFIDITPHLIPILQAEYEIVYYGNGWRNRVSLSDVIEGWDHSHEMYGKRVASIKGVNYFLDEFINVLASELEVDRKARDEKIFKLAQQRNKLGLDRLKVEEFDKKMEALRKPRKFTPQELGIQPIPPRAS